MIRNTRRTAKTSKINYPGVNSNLCAQIARRHFVAQRHFDATSRCKNANGPACSKTFHGLSTIFHRSF